MTTKQEPLDPQEEFEGECLAHADALCAPFYSQVPEKGIGILIPQSKVEAGYNAFIKFLPAIAAVLMVFIAIFITIDVVGRLLFNKPWVGITDLEVLFMSAIGFTTLAFPIIQRQSIQIDLFYDRFSGENQRILYLFGNIISCGVAATLAWRAVLAGMHWSKETGILEIPEWPSVTLTGICFGLAAIAFLFQIFHIVTRMVSKKEYAGIFINIVLVSALVALPFVYKAIGIKIPGLAIGSLGFLILMCLMLLRVPLGFAMSAIGVLGLLAVLRTPSAAMNAFAAIPFVHTSSFIMIAFPMFMLMGEMVTLAGLSDDLFDAAKKWLGRLPGGLAVATVGGCAGFGAVCGDSMATVITMTSVALPAMRESKYDLSLSTGALAAGGTLGILIPPSMGFIIYSMITEESVGKLFIAGILPGLLLCAIFMLIIIFQVKRNPSLAPKTAQYPMAEKLMSLVMLLPVVMLFLVVVIGILDGWFTPAEGGAVGTVMAFFYALARRRLTWAKFKHTMYHSAAMFGKIFALFVGLYVLGAFLTASRLPSMLATTVADMEVNRYIILFAIIALYIVLGCVMNIMPMMMLTLPSIYPTVQAIGFDGIWFGVICVIVMEMGMITPPVGMNVFTLAGLQPDISMSTIFKGVFPFFAGMLLCVLLVILFPQIALVLL